MVRLGLLAFAVMLMLDGWAGAASLPGEQASAQLVFLVHGRGRVVAHRVGDELSLTPALLPLNPGLVTMPGVVAVETQHNRTVVRLSHDATVKSRRIPGRLVLEVAIVPPAETGASGTGSVEASQAGGALPGLPASMIAVVDPPTISTAPRAAQAFATVDPPSGASPVSIAASLLPTTADRPGSLLLPFDRTVAAAAFRRGGRLDVVFSRRKPIDLSVSDDDPVFRQARLTLLPAGTLLDMPIEPNQVIALTRVADGWLLSAKPPETHHAGPEPQADGVIFRMAEAGDVLTVTDPAGGGDLLVGTVRGDARNVVGPGSTPGYRIVPSMLGVVVERLSDRVELRPLAIGFRLIDPFPPLGSRRADPASSFSRSVEMPAVDQAEQWRRYKDCLASSASLPPGSRRAPRLDAARSALALGLGREARMLAEAADRDAPNGMDRPGSAFLIGAGALLAGDADAARLLADPLIGNSDEAALWRSVAAGRLAQVDRPAARSVAAAWRLLQSYPEPVRQELLGDAALLLTRSGDEAARTLVAGLADATGEAGLARALVSEGLDHDKPALAMLDHLFADRDPDVSLSAGLEAVELRLRNHLIGPGEAARRVQGLIYDGRMAGREREVALRAAQLHAEAKEWPAALSILRQQASSPEEEPSGIKHLAGEILVQAAKAMPADGGGSGASGSEDALRAITLLQQNQDLLPPGIDRTGLLTTLADRLVANDLPGRATSFLRQTLDQAPPRNRNVPTGPRLDRGAAATGRRRRCAQGVRGRGSRRTAVGDGSTGRGHRCQAAVCRRRPPGGDRSAVDAAGRNGVGAPRRADGGC